MVDFFVKDFQRGAGKIGKGADIVRILFFRRFFFFFRFFEHHLPEGVAVFILHLFKADVFGHIFQHFIQSLVSEVLCMIPVPSQAVAGLGDQKGFSHIESRRQEVVDLLLLFRGQHIGFDPETKPAAFAAPGPKSPCAHPIGKQADRIRTGKEPAAFPPALNAYLEAISVLCGGDGRPYGQIAWNLLLLYGLLDGIARKGWTNRADWTAFSQSSFCSSSFALRRVRAASSRLSAVSLPQRSVGCGWHGFFRA